MLEQLYPSGGLANTGSGRRPNRDYAAMKFEFQGCGAAAPRESVRIWKGSSHVTC